MAASSTLMRSVTRYSLHGQLGVHVVVGAVDERGGLLVEDPVEAWERPVLEQVLDAGGAASLLLSLLLAELGVTLLLLHGFLVRATIVGKSVREVACLPFVVELAELPLGRRLACEALEVLDIENSVRLDAVGTVGCLRGVGHLVTPGGAWGRDDHGASHRSGWQTARSS